MKNNFKKRVPTYLNSQTTLYSQNDFSKPQSLCLKTKSGFLFGSPLELKQATPLSSWKARIWIQQILQNYRCVEQGCFSFLPPASPGLQTTPSVMISMPYSTGRVGYPTL